MNQAVLAELQRQQAYPSVTLLMNTTPGTALNPAELSTARHLLDRADQRLLGDVSDACREAIVSKVGQLIDEMCEHPTSQAIAFCVSEHYAGAVHLARGVDERVVIDDTFATRDLVAEMTRSAVFRLVTISDRRARVLVGDRQRLVEEHSDVWPMVRAEEQSGASWTRHIGQQLRAHHQEHPLPTVVAGVTRSVRRNVLPDSIETIGFIAGNHDRTSWIELHNQAWPLVADWVRTESARSLKRLEAARSSCRYAGGIEEIWPLANAGRVEVLVVEESYAVPARVDANQQLLRAADRESPDVVDDIIDDTIEVVLRHGGQAVIVGDAELCDHERVAAVLRY